MEKLLKAVGDGVLYVASFVTFIVAVGLAVLDRTASASVMAAMCVTMVLFANLPRLESFKAFGVEAKLREKIAEAQATLDQLKQLTLTSARQTYYQLASIGRFSDSNIELKDSLTAELGALLSGFNVEEKEAKRAREPYVRMMRIDLMGTYRQTAAYLLHRHLRECEKEIRAFTQPIKATDTEYHKLIERQRGYGQLPGPFLDGGDYSRDRFVSMVETEQFKGFLDDDEARKLKGVGRELLRLDAECERLGHYTPEALNVVQAYRPYNSTEQKFDALLQAMPPQD